MSKLYKVVNGFDAMSGAAFGGGGGGGGGGGEGRGDQSRRAEAVRKANAARARAAAATAAANQRQKEQNEANRQREIQATIRAAEKKEATRQANIAAASAKLAEERRVNQAREAHAAYTARVKQEEINATKSALINGTSRHVNGKDGIDVANLDKNKTYIMGRPLVGGEVLGVQHSATLFHDGEAWTTLGYHNKNDKVDSRLGDEQDDPTMAGQIVLGTVNTGHMSNQSYVQAMINADGGYNDQAEYDSVPGAILGEGWNCNGMTTGMLNKLGGTVTPFDGKDINKLTGATTSFNFTN